MFSIGDYVTVVKCGVRPLVYRKIPTGAIGIIVDSILYIDNITLYAVEFQGDKTLVFRDHSLSLVDYGTLNNENR